MMNGFEAAERRRMNDSVLGFAKGVSTGRHCLSGAMEVGMDRANDLLREISTIPGFQGITHGAREDIAATRQHGAGPTRSNRSLGHADPSIQTCGL